MARTVATPSRVPHDIIGGSLVAGLVVQPGDSSPSQICELFSTAVVQPRWRHRTSTLVVRAAIRSVALVLKGARTSVRVGFRRAGARSGPVDWTSWRGGPGAATKRVGWTRSRWRRRRQDRAERCHGVWARLDHLLRSSGVCALPALAHVSSDARCKGGGFGWRSNTTSPRDTPDGVDPSGFRRHPWRHG